MRVTERVQGDPSDRQRLTNAMDALTLDGYTVWSDLPYLTGHTPSPDKPQVIFWAKASMQLAFTQTGRLIRPFHLHYTGSERDGARIRQRLREAGLRPNWSRRDGSPVWLQP